MARYHPIENVTTQRYAEVQADSPEPIDSDVRNSGSGVRSSGETVYEEMAGLILQEKLEGRRLGLLERIPVF